MPNTLPIQEFRSAWLPHVSDDGLNRLIDLLRTASPLLIHGAFTTAVPMGCLASHIGWNHPTATRRNEDAGIFWLTKVAGLNPATSHMILAWDDTGPCNWQLRQDLLAACREEADRRSEAVPTPRCAAPC